MDSVLFDPGIGELVIDFNEYVNRIYSQLMSLRSLSQKRTKFRLYSSSIEKNMKNNIAFYLGCLLWALYLTKEYENNPKTITGNVFLAMSEEEKQNYDYMIQINFLENYFDSFERDYLYYTGKKYVIPEKWKKILKLYSELLEKNEGFIRLEKTSDLKLPEMLKNININVNINELINKVITQKDLNMLLNIENLNM